MELSFRHFIRIITGKEKAIKLHKMQNSIKFLTMLNVKIDNNLVQQILSRNKIFGRYFFNTDYKHLSVHLNQIDATLLPAVSGEIRQYQKRLLNFAKKLFNEIEKNNFKYFMVGGSLLGAIRHGGYIPWDDDLDFDVMREDYERMSEWAKNNFLWLDTSNCTDYNHFMDLLIEKVDKNPNTIIFARKKTSLSAYCGDSFSNVMVIDFFPRDYLNPDLSISDYQKYRNNKQKQYKHLKTWKEYFEFEKNEYSNQEIYAQHSNTTVRGWGSYGFNDYQRIHPIDDRDIFPLKKIPFEDFSFLTMNTSHNYLEKMYGDYMKIPAILEICMHLNAFKKHLKRNNRKYYIDVEKIINGENNDR